MIKTYEGIEGIRTISYNSLNAKGNLYICEMSFASLNEIFSNEEAEKIRGQFLERNIKIKEITNKAYHEQYEGYTQLKEYREKCMDIRYISPDKFLIETEFLIYDDVVAFYTYPNNIFAIEIHNKNLAKTQLQMFDMLWSMGERPVIGKNGRTSML